VCKVKSFVRVGDFVGAEEIHFSIDLLIRIYVFADCCYVIVRRPQSC